MVKTFFSPSFSFCALARFSLLFVAASPSWFILRAHVCSGECRQYGVPLCSDISHAAALWTGCCFDDFDFWDADKVPEKKSHSKGLRFLSQRAHPTCTADFWKKQKKDQEHCESQLYLFRNKTFYTRTHIKVQIYDRNQERIRIRGDLSQTAHVAVWLLATEWAGGSVGG